MRSSCLRPGLYCSLLLAVLTHSCRASTCQSTTMLALTADPLEKEYLPLAPFGLQPPIKSSEGHVLRLASHKEACEPLETVPSDSILLAYRGTCLFVEKAQMAAQAGATGLIIINNSTSIPEECLYIGGSGNDTDLASLSSLFVAGATAEEGALLVNLTQNGDTPVEATASFALIQVPTMDPAALVLLALAVTTIVIAAAWTGMEFKEMLAQQEAQPVVTAQPDSPSPSVPTTFDRGGEQQIVTIPVVLTFVVFTSIMMFVLFFILNKWIFYVFVGLFAYGAAVASGVCMHTLVATFQPAWLRPTLPIKWSVMPKIRVSDVTIGAVSIAAAVIWVIFRKASWAWVLQNMLGMCFMTFVLQTVTLPSLRVASVFLVALFFYDVFMVFITPLFMPRGDSVMVRVATGGDTHEILPMLLLVPRLMPGPPSRGMMLGYGDVVVPGLLIMLLRRFDVAMSRGISTLSYTFWAVLAYIVGILLTDAALVYNIGGSKGQPALLYLVPCTLGTAALLAWLRGDFPALWRGQIVDVKDHDSGDASYHGPEQPVEGRAAGSSAVAHRAVPEQEHVAMPGVAPHDRVGAVDADGRHAADNLDLLDM